MHTFIDGTSQFAYIRKEDATLLTVMTDSLFITGAINTYQHEKVGACVLPGDFLHTVINKKVIMVLHGELCELMVKVNLKCYQKFVLRDKKGIPVLYMELYNSMDRLI